MTTDNSIPVRRARRQQRLRLLSALPLAAALCTAALPAHAGLTFSTTFDASVTAVAGAQAAINAALAEYTTLFSDNVNVSLYFKFSGNGLGTSSTFSFGQNYQTFYSALVADGTPGPGTDTTALARLAVDGSGALNPVNATGIISQGRAGLAAVGIVVDTTGLDTGAGDGLYYDGVIDLNLGIMNLDRITIDPNKYDLKAVTQHEVNEVMGTISNVTQNDPRPADLFRFDGAGNRSFTSNTNSLAYFSIDGTTQLARYNQSGSGDWGDWFSCPNAAPVAQVQDACSSPGGTPNLGVEVTLLDAIGWTRVSAANGVPEPGSLALIGLALSGLVASRRKA